MEIEQVDFADNFILKLTVSEADFPGSSVEARMGNRWQLLDAPIIESLEAVGNKSRFQVSWIVIDFSRLASPSERLGDWVAYQDLAPPQIVHYVRDRNGKLLLLGPDNLLANSRCRRKLNWGSWVRSWDQALEAFRQHAAELKTDLDLVHSDEVSSSLASRIRLVGCPDNDLGYLPEELLKFGIDVEVGEPFESGDKVVFCLSSTLSITDGTRKALDSLRGKEIYPIAIVLVYADLVNNDSLRQLTTVEERELLSWKCQIPSDDLPCLQDVAPDFVSQILKLAREANTLVYVPFDENDEWD